MSVNSKMTALADEIRELSGAEDAMGLDTMAEHIGEANEDVATEAGLIAQITTALEGKAVGDGNGNGVDICTVTVRLPDGSIEAGAFIDYSGYSTINGKTALARYDNTTGSSNYIEFRSIVQNTMMFVYHPSKVLSYPPYMSGDVKITAGNSQLIILQIKGNAVINFA